jgi:hypothetical protein
VHDLWGWLSLVLAILLVLGWYLSSSAARLDRLHHRVESARAALDAQLVRRAAMAVETAQLLDPSSALPLADAAAEALAVGEDGTRGFGEGVSRGSGREEAENELSRALHAALDDFKNATRLRGEPMTADALGALAQACERAQLARRFHNDAVAQAQRVRRKRVVRWARLAGRAEMPEMFEIDDTLPTSLSP